MSDHSRHSSILHKLDLNAAAESFNLHESTKSREPLSDVARLSRENAQLADRLAWAETRISALESANAELRSLLRSARG